jgi:hypothetical protein
MGFWGGLGPVPKVALSFLLQSHLKTYRVILVTFDEFVKYHKTQKKVVGYHSHNFMFM